ncbi:hypothetical protein Dester_0979 [Desulfurobacterium thermolithotrophum DSM 11699]|uniref:Phosphate-selective porin O and P n=1 Tax=Desulfurobacterium thermolithotrophum (strain DSM 11699 / BSA) TaxID=868864 RepID=F0S446_DESTD|nr:hypothetical protein [Desulfurobacterium thermolithotrophum]ADY73618.1 hypothetical protein Dester_0979 [Desulfurobacterium thermolithotrophum DSM 11699]
MKKTLALASALLMMGMGTSSMAKDATVLIGGVPVKQLYVDEEGRLYLTPGEGRKPVKIEVPAAKGTPLVSKDKKIKIEGKAYIHYDVDLKNGNHNNAFKITRNYFEVRGYFNDKDYFRTTLDVKQEKDSGGNMDGSYVARLKYAYVYFADVLPYTGVELGLAHRPWIDWEEHHGWLHRDVEETLIENHSGAGLINSADLGANFKGKYGIASWEFGIFNGEGYHGAEDSDHFGKSLEGRLSLNLFEGFTLSGHTVHSFDHKDKDMDRHIYQIHAVYNNPYFLVAAQYIWDKDDYYNSNDVTQKGYSVNGDLKLKPFTGYPLGIFARYDHWDTNTDADNSVRKHFVYGAFYKLNKHVKLTLAHDRVLAEDNAGSDSNTLMAVAQVKW